MDIQGYLSTRETNHNYNVHRKELHAFFEYCISPLKVLEESPVAKVQTMPEGERKKRGDPERGSSRCAAPSCTEVFAGSSPRADYDPDPHAPLPD